MDKSQLNKDTDAKKTAGQARQEVTSGQKEQGKIKQMYVYTLTTGFVKQPAEI